MVPQRIVTVPTNPLPLTVIVAPLVPWVGLSETYRGVDSRVKVALAEPPVPSLQVITFIPVAKVGVVATTLAVNVPLALATT